MSTKFHSNAQLLLTAGPDKNLHLFHVDGHRNPKMQSMTFSDLPIRHADFTADGSEVWLCGNRRYFYVYNIEKGTVSKVPGLRGLFTISCSKRRILLGSNSNRVFTGRPDKKLSTFSSSPDGKLMAFACESGYVSLVSTSTKQAIGSVKISGSVKRTSFSGDGSELYTYGSDGHVMIWDARTYRCRDRIIDQGCVDGSSIAVAPRRGVFATGYATHCP